MGVTNHLLTGVILQEESGLFPSSWNMLESEFEFGTSILESGIWIKFELWIFFVAFFGKQNQGNRSGKDRFFSTMPCIWEMRDAV